MHIRNEVVERGGAAAAAAARAVRAPLAIFGARGDFDSGDRERDTLQWGWRLPVRSNVPAPAGAPIVRSVCCLRGAVSRMYEVTRIEHVRFFYVVATCILYSGVYRDAAILARCKQRIIL